MMSNHNPPRLFLAFVFLSLLASPFAFSQETGETPRTGEDSSRKREIRIDTLAFHADSARVIVNGLAAQLDSTVSYDPSYVAIEYPNGDVPLYTGVCADVIVRSFRNAGIDLQVAIHSDMKRNFRQYPQMWGARGPDRNIDHRRVPNQMKFFERMGKGQPITNEAKNYFPGDVVAWKLPGGRFHIGIVTNLQSPYSANPLIAHNIGGGAKLHDVLFAWEVIGHYRWY